MTTVIPLASKLRATRCAVCEGSPSWQVGPLLRSCDRCLAHCLRAAYQESDGFAPPLVSPLGSVRTLGGVS